jgi:hypothetical protein
VTVKVHVISDTEGWAIDSDALAALPLSVIEGTLRQICEAARDFWITRAGQELTSGRRDYLNGIQPVMVSGSVGTIALVGTLANMIEEGASAFDMRTTMLGAGVPVVEVGSGMKGKHQNAKGGFYRAIPFRHQTPESSGQGGGAPMGSQFGDHPLVNDALALGKAIHKAAKKLDPTTGMPGEPTQWGGRLPAGMAPRLKAHHVTDIFAGMVKVEKQYEKSKQSTYVTFRTISTTSGHPDSWMHPGIEAEHLADEVSDFIDQIAPAAFAALAIGGD